MNGAVVNPARTQCAGVLAPGQRCPFPAVPGARLCRHHQRQQDHRDGDR